MGFGALIIGVIFMLIGWIVSSRLKNKFREYSQTHLTKDLTGAEIAKLMLADHGLHNVQVISVEGQLSDHKSRHSFLDDQRVDSFVPFFRIGLRDDDIHTG